MSAVPAWVCPRCRGALASGGDAYRCAPCDATYPIVLGIPDFRLLPDPWIAQDDDNAKARRLAAETEGQGVEATVRAYWAMTPATPRHLAERFTRHVMTAEERSREWVATLDATPRAAGDAIPAGPWLDAGCRTGDLLVPIAERGRPAVGVDVAMRWLVVARKRLDAAGLARVPLACANAEYLPLPDRSFARVLAAGLLENAIEAGRVLGEARRALADRGDVILRTVNRYTLLPEPHVGVWGVGLVPRRWADRYVRWRNGQRYLHHRPLSARELRRALRQAGFAGVRVAPATLLVEERSRLGPAARWVAPLYDRARRAPIARGGLALVAPLLEGVGVAS